MEFTLKKNRATLLTLPGNTDSFAKKWLLKACAQIRDGHLIIEDGDQVYCFGQAREAASVCAKIRVHDKSAYRDFFMRGSVGAGEGYMRKAWSTPDLLALVRLMVRNLDWLNRVVQKRPWFSRWLLDFGMRLRHNSRSGARNNIAAHYDLGNHFFSAFLDETMMYSAAIYPNENASLQQASIHKMEIICRRLQLTAQDHLLEIGSGWGGMAIYAARHFGCRVTTTTISQAQYDYCLAKVHALQLQDKVQVLLQDYRDLTGRYDKIVSIEMLEAVGHEYYPTYFSRCSELLRENGLMLIQVITVPDRRYQLARRTTDFIKQMIFPGGCLPSNAVLAHNVYRHTDMQIIDLADITAHYARTLADWYTRFKKNEAQIRAQGFDGGFCRMWEFYLRYCEGGFRERVINTAQLLLAKPSYRSVAPLTGGRV